MSKLLIIQNISREGPGLLARTLKNEGLAFDAVDLDMGQPLPKPNGYKAAVILGGPNSANDDTVKMNNELAFIQQVLDLQIPYLGICLGLQTLVKAAGGKVLPSAIKEVGFINPSGDQHTVTKTEVGRTDPLLSGLPSKLNVFQLHGETVELTPSMIVLATGKFCRNQIVRVADKAYGIQSHFELTQEMLATWAAQDPDLIPLGNDKLQADFAAIEQSYAAIGEVLFKNFLNIAGLSK